MSIILRYCRSFPILSNGRTLPNVTAINPLLCPHIGNINNRYLPKTRALSWFSKKDGDGGKKKGNIKKLLKNSMGRSGHIDFLPSMVSLGSSQDDEEPNSGTLVVLCGWLEAKEKYLNKYVHLYHKRDIDVLRVQTRLKDWLSPTETIAPNSVRVALGLNEVRSIYPNIIFHCFSSGCYFYASVVEAIQNGGPELDATLASHLKGVIFDSMIDVTYVLSHKKALDVVLKPKVMRMFRRKKFSDLLLNQGKTCPLLLRYDPEKLDFFIQKNKVIQENPYKLPTLLLFSQIDAFSDMNTNFKLVEKWHRQGVEVMSQCWRDAPHVQLYRSYPEEYDDWIGSFLTRVTNK